jgi:hypothetical protein
MHRIWPAGGTTATIEKLGREPEFDKPVLEISCRQKVTSFFIFIVTVHAAGDAKHRGYLQGAARDGWKSACAAAGSVQVIGADVYGLDGIALELECRRPTHSR